MTTIHSATLLHADPEPIEVRIEKTFVETYLICCDEDPSDVDAAKAIAEAMGSEYGSLGEALDALAMLVADYGECGTFSPERITAWALAHPSGSDE